MKTRMYSFLPLLLCDVKLTLYTYSAFLRCRMKRSSKSGRRKVFRKSLLKPAQTAFVLYAHPHCGRTVSLSGVDFRGWYAPPVVISYFRTAPHCLIQNIRMNDVARPKRFDHHLCSLSCSCLPFFPVVFQLTAMVWSTNVPVVVG